MLSWDHGGFSLNANVRIEAQDRAGLERLIRYCARPVFSGERLDWAGDKLQYRLPKPTADGQTVLLLKPFELLDKLSSLIPPPRRHRHHYHGVLAPNSPLRSKIASLVNKEISPTNTAQETKPFSSECLSFAINCKELEIDQKALISPPPNQPPEIAAEIPDRPKEKKQPSKASLFRWAMLMARIFEVLPLCCPKCNHPMRIISFIQDEHSIRKILTHVNEPIQPPPIIPARGPPESEFDYDQSHEFA
ncbi:MAG: family transposase [Parachlamydiales bacterium]|nr:family transposase [Parachlamydiales bacterium]